MYLVRTLCTCMQRYKDMNFQTFFRRLVTSGLLFFLSGWRPSSRREPCTTCCSWSETFGMGPHLAGGNNGVLWTFWGQFFLRQIFFGWTHFEGESNNTEKALFGLLIHHDPWKVSWKLSEAVDLYSAFTQVAEGQGRTPAVERARWGCWKCVEVTFVGGYMSFRSLKVRCC